jgi:copper chaperone CopZ
VETITLVAPDISCEHCQRTIETALSEIAGVANVGVDVAAKSIRRHVRRRRNLARCDCRTPRWRGLPGSGLIRRRSRVL